MALRARQSVTETVRTATTGLLCALLMAPQALAAMGATDQPAAPVKLAPLTQQQRVLHALNRFTFGPRPGDEAAVSRMGLEKWFEQQLHPETIDDSAFEGKMDQFPAMRLSREDLMRRYPFPGMLKTMERQDLPLPMGKVERAIYADNEAAYDAKIKGQAQQNKEAAANAAKLGADAKPDAQPMAAANMNDMTATAAMTDTAAVAATDTGKKGKRKNLSAPMDEDGVQAVLEFAPDQRLATLVSMKPAEMLAFRAALRQPQRLQLMQGLSPVETEEVEALVTAPERVVASEALESRLERDVYTERQLQAVMTDFWLNHFSVYVRKSQFEPYYLPSYERQVILPNALGKFENLLVATAASPAMLMYLDNWESAGAHSVEAERAQTIDAMRGKGARSRPVGINENYGRELMELHTLGVNGGYTQQDVIEVAKCFTGWTIDRPNLGGGAVYDDSRHEPGSKTVLGYTIKQGGEREGLEVLHILATSPSTAHFISEKLAERFVSDTPPPALVDRMTATFLKSDGDIKAVLTTMFHSPEFWSPQVYRAKVKTPVEFMASALRASGATVENPLPLVQAMDRLGMPIFGMQTPNGYSWEAADWVSSNALISRMNFALVLSSDRVPGTQTDWPALLGEQDSAVVEGAPDAATEHRLEMLLLGQPATAHTRETVLAQFTNPTAQHDAEENFKARATAQNESDGTGGGRLLRTKAGRPGPAGRDGPMNAKETPLDTMAGLLLGSPEFQRR